MVRRTTPLTRGQGPGQVGYCTASTGGAIGGLALAALVVLGGCGGSPRALDTWRWDRPGTTQEGFEHDRRQCLRGATHAGMVGTRPEVNPERFAACMTVRGYTRSPSGEFVAPPAAAPAAR